MFGNVGIRNSDAGESPKRKNTTNLVFSLFSMHLIIVDVNAIKRVCSQFKRIIIITYYFLLRVSFLFDHLQGDPNTRGNMI